MAFLSMLALRLIKFLVVNEEKGKRELTIADVRSSNVELITYHLVQTRLSFFSSCMTHAKCLVSQYYKEVQVSISNKDQKATNSLKVFYSKLFLMVHRISESVMWAIDNA